MNPRRSSPGRSSPARLRFADAADDCRWGSAARSPRLADVMRGHGYRVPSADRREVAAVFACFREPRFVRERRGAARAAALPEEKGAPPAARKQPPGASAREAGRNGSSFAACAQARGGRPRASTLPRQARCGQAAWMRGGRFRAGGYPRTRGRRRREPGAVRALRLYATREEG